MIKIADKYLRLIVMRVGNNGWTSTSTEMFPHPKPKTAAGDFKDEMVVIWGTGHQSPLAGVKLFLARYRDTFKLRLVRLASVLDDIEGMMGFGFFVSHQ